MRIHSFLIRGDGSSLSSKLNSFTSLSLNALAFFSLGIDHSKIIECALKFKTKCPVYLTETYGIIGYDEELQQNIELMEKGRGSEYGFRGGSGGQGCLVVGVTDAVTGHSDLKIPGKTSSLMVIADTSKTFERDYSSSTIPLHYGGIAKEAWIVSSNSSLERVPYFWIANQDESMPIGVSAFKGDASSATKELLLKKPSGFKTDCIGLFPCFSRGINQYNAENVESQAITSVLDINDGAPTRIYGMFAHGELGPSNNFYGFVNDENDIKCEQYGMTSILSIHTQKE